MEKDQVTCLKRISIIILTHDRVKYIERLFSTLSNELESFGSPAETIIIDDSGSDETASIATMCEKYKYRFYFFKGSISAKRNFGIQTCSYDVILFIDSDCEVTPGLLYEHISGYAQNNIGGVLGLTNFTGKQNWVWKVVKRTSFPVGFSFAKKMDYAPWGPCTNISFRKDVIEKTGGFRTEFPFDFSGEDVDIGLRINELGYKIKCNPKAIINHHRQTWSNFLKLSRKIFRWGRTDFHILKHHPKLSSLEFPRFSTISLLVVILFVSCKLMGISWEISKFLIIWMLCVPFIEALLRSYRSKKKISDFLFTYLSLWLTFIFELGTIFESLKNRSFLMLYKKLLYGPSQLIFEWEEKVRQSWSFIIGFLIILLLLL